MVNNSKRFLSLLLALVMVIALVPVSYANAEVVIDGSNITMVKGDTYTIEDIPGDYSALAGSNGVINVDVDVESENAKTYTKTPVTDLSSLDGTYVIFAARDENHGDPNYAYYANPVIANEISKNSNGTGDKGLEIAPEELIAPNGAAADLAFWTIKKVEGKDGYFTISVGTEFLSINSRNNVTLEAAAEVKIKNATLNGYTNCVLIMNESGLLLNYYNSFRDTSRSEGAACAWDQNESDPGAQFYLYEAFDTAAYTSTLTFTAEAAGNTTIEIGGTEYTVVVTETACTHENTETIPGQAPTLNASGWTDGTKCSDCGKVLVEREVAPQVHYNDGIVPLDAVTVTVGEWDQWNQWGDGGAAELVDDNFGTIWHTVYSAGHESDTEKYWVQFELKDTYEVTGLRCKPRNNGGNTTIDAFKVLGSNDGETFTEITSGNWGTDDAWKEVTFDAQTYKYIRLKAIKTSGHASAAEVRLVGTKVEAPAKFNIAGANMTLGESLDMNFFVEPANVDNVDGVYAVITKKFADGREDSVTEVALDKTKKYDGKYYFTLSDVSAKEMTDEITVVVYNGNKEAISNVWTDSMKGYAIRLYDLKDEYKAFAADLLNYGAAAQTYFNYNVNNLANAGEEAQAILGSATTTVAPAPAQNKVAPCIGATLLLQNRIQLNFVYKTEDLTGVQSATAVIGEDEIVIPASDFGFVDKEEKYMYIPVEGVKIADCYESITLTVGESSTTDSVASYCERVDGDLFDAILKLATSAKDVLGK